MLFYNIITFPQKNRRKLENCQNVKFFSIINNYFYVYFFLTSINFLFIFIFCFEYPETIFNEKKVARILGNLFIFFNILEYLF